MTGGKTMGERKGNRVKRKKENQIRERKGGC